MPFEVLLEEGVSWQWSWVCPLYSEWQSRCPCWWTRTELHAARASYKPEWFLRSLIIPQNSSSEVELPPQRQSRTELHFLPASLFFTCLTVLSCGWKPSVRAHPGSLEETLLCKACESEEGHFHQVLHPVSSEATTRRVLCAHCGLCSDDPSVRWVTLKGSVGSWHYTTDMKY